jgi:hypothetical protein
MTQSFASSRVSIPGTISTNGFVWSYRTRAPVGLKSDGLRSLPSRASAVSQSVASRILPGNGRLAARTLERSGPNTVGARALAAAFSNLRRDMSGPRSLNLCRPKSTAGKCFSFLRALVQHPQKSGRSVTHGFGFAPVHVLSLSALCHVKQHDSRRDGNVRIRIGEVRNVVR